jgi:hypothetical protein
MLLRLGLMNVQDRNDFSPPFTAIESLQGNYHGRNRGNKTRLTVLLSILNRTSQEKLVVCKAFTT